MNKYNRNKHMKIMSLMNEAAIVLPNLIQEGRISEIPQLLADCQDVAIAFGAQIEQLYGMQTKTVAALEEYCNALYEVSVTMNKESFVMLAEAMDKIQLTYQMEFPEKREVIFMPYKASMWDSLESVWMAAKEDENCEVYVVPIPYYDRNKDHSFGEFHYEGGLFPKYVPITHYEEYDMDLRRPDVVYIHNPYDDNNYVTSVAPSYYSTEIKKYTDTLVYIPYFVVDEERNLHRVEHYACLSGVYHADKVVVQSERIKKMYIDTLSKKVEDMPRRFWEEKILGLGSPKYDAVHSHSIEISEIPEEWKELIGDKKVILYNTHLGLLMAEKYKVFLKKLRRVINLFKNRDDVVLLWRPHPLMISTAKAMNPVAVNEYLDIVNEYCEKKYGIYDDTADMHRAIAISDAYYGSPSSMFPLYKSTGKLVLRHDIYAETEMERKYIEHEKDNSTNDLQKEFLEENISLSDYLAIVVRESKVSTKNESQNIGAIIHSNI